MGKPYDDETSEKKHPLNKVYVIDWVLENVLFSSKLSKCMNIQGYPVKIVYITNCHIHTLIKNWQNVCSMENTSQQHAWLVSNTIFMH